MTEKSKTTSQKKEKLPSQQLRSRHPLQTGCTTFQASWPRVGPRIWTASLLETKKLSHKSCSPERWPRTLGNQDSSPSALIRLIKVGFQPGSYVLMELKIASLMREQVRLQSTTELCTRDRHGGQELMSSTIRRERCLSIAVTVRNMRPPHIIQ